MAVRLRRARAARLGTWYLPGVGLPGVPLVGPPGGLHGFAVYFPPRMAYGPASLARRLMYELGTCQIDLEVLLTVVRNIAADCGSRQPAGTTALLQGALSAQAWLDGRVFHPAQAAGLDELRQGRDAVCAWARWLAGAALELVARCGMLLPDDLRADLERAAAGGTFRRRVGRALGGADLLPLRDPGFCLRECCKDLALLEDHLIQPDRRCADCIGKHALRAEAFAEEATVMGAGPEAAASARAVRAVWEGLRAGTLSPDVAGQRVRGLRKAVYAAIPPGPGAALPP